MSAYDLGDITVPKRVANVPHKAQPIPVFINGRFLSQRVTGVQRYARETLKSLDDLLNNGSEYDWTLLMPRGTVVPKLNRIKTEPCGRLRGHLWEQFELPWRARSGILFSFGATGPILHRRQIVTVHDASVVRMPQTFTWRYRWWHRFVVERMVARALRTIVVSNFGASEARDCFGARPERIRVCTEGWQHLNDVVSDDRILQKHGLVGTRYVLAVSSPSPNKNFAAVASALSMLGKDAPLCAAAGAVDSRVFSRGGESTPGVVRLGYVSDAELKALYHGAACFVFPSHYEGFGIPPLEAMACGCPVIASTALAVREVCGDAALYFDPTRPEQLAARLCELEKSSSLRQMLVDAGHERAALFSWAKAGKLNMRVIEEIL